MATCASLLDVQQFKQACIEILKQLATEGVLQYVFDHTSAGYLESVVHYTLSQGDTRTEQRVDELLDVFLQALPKQ